MSRSVLMALLLIGLTVLVLLFNMKDAVTVDLLLTTVRHKSALIFLGFTAVGVSIGLLLR